MSSPKQKQSIAKIALKETGVFLLDILYNAVVIIILVVLIRSFLISPFRVIGSSMADTLQNKEFILIDKLSYIVGDIDRGDPIVFLPPASSRDTPKFEEKISIKEDGSGKLDLRSLVTTKSANYCKGSLKSLFICREKVEAGDLVYYAPLEHGVGSSLQADWNMVEVTEVTKSNIKDGFLTIQGERGEDYMMRVYDSMGPDYFVKRVIGVPGDQVKIENGRVYLKTDEDKEFRQIDESFLNQENLNRTYISQKQRQNIYEVPEGKYFVLGDNRNHSNDSRSWLEPVTQDAYPFLSEANISGKVSVVLWPVVNLRLIGSADL